MVRKKFLAVFLTFVMALTMLPWAWGEEGAANSGPLISEQKAVEIVQQVVGDVIKPEYSFDISLEDRYYLAGKKVWRLSWYDSRPQRGRSFYLSASVDAITGELLEFSQYPVTPQPLGKLLSRQEAQEKAVAFINSQHPEKLQEVTLKENPLYYYGSGNYIDLSYHFSWERQVNGIPVEGDGFHVSVDAASGVIVNYQYTWTPGVNPQQVEVLAGETVKEQVLKKLGVVLSYGYSLGTVQPSLPLKPVYRLNTASFAYVDAQTGEPLDYYGRILTWEEVSQFDQDFSYEPKESTTGAKEATRRISAQEGLAKAQEFFQALGKSGKVVRSGGGGSIEPDGYQREFWSYTLEQEKGSSYQGPRYSVGIDVSTGQVVNYHNWDNLDGQEPEGGRGLSREEAQKIAEEFLRKVQPGVLDQLILAKESTSPYSLENGLYYFNWIRLVNGIPFERDGISVAVHQGTGEVVSYDYNWSESRFAAPQQIISAEEAQKILAQNIKPVLAYVQPNRFGDQPGQPILVYRFEYPQGYLVDAQTGELLGEPAHSVQSSENQAVSQTMELLRASGIVPAGATEDTLVTRRQALKAILAMRGSYYGSSRQEQEQSSFKDISSQDPDYRLIEEAVQSGLIAPGGNFNPEKNIDRETAAIWAVKALNYGKLAELPITIELPVKDAKKIAPEARNYVALALGLGLLQPRGDQFQPQETLNWQEMAELVVRGTLYSRSGN